jgi:serine/threonine-protein kinase HipA
MERDILKKTTAYFALTPILALKVLSDVCKAVKSWRNTALGVAVRLQPHELDDFAPAFEHDQMEKALRLVSSY